MGVENLSFCLALEIFLIKLPKISNAEKMLSETPEVLIVVGCIFQVHEYNYQFVHHVLNNNFIIVC